MKYAVCMSCTKVHKLSNRVPVQVDGGHEMACPECSHLWYRKFCHERVVRVVHRDDGSTLECVALPTTRRESKATHG